jgi:predicted dehydrogenase
MSTTSVSCRRIIEAAEAAGIDLQVSFMHRHFEEVEAARQLVADGAIGTVTSLRQRNATPGPDWGDWFFKRERVGGGVVLQLGTHGIDLVEHLFGPIAGVSARTAILLGRRTLADGRVVEVENPDSAWCLYDLAGGVMASHEVSMVEAKGCDRFRLEIYGTTGTIWLRSERGPLAVCQTSTKEWTMPALPEAPLGRRHHGRWIEGLLGRAPREATAREALHGLLVVEAIERSAARGGCREAVAA